MSEHNKLAKFNLKSVNILAESKHRTMEVEPLKKITMDGMISTQRLLFGTFIYLGLIIIVIVYLLGDMQRVKYVWLPLLALGISITVIMANYLISSRDKSMLSSVAILLSDRILERVRRKAKRSGDLKSVGIEKFDDKTGLVVFRDGRIGKVYEVEGTLSRSTLPVVANQTAIVKAQYLVARSSTSYEKLILSIKQVNLREQLGQLEEYNQKANTNSMSDEWRRYMIQLMYNYIQNDLDGQETTVTQVLILSDDDKQAFENTEFEFMSAVDQGMYSRARAITNREELVEKLSPLTMLSKGGISTNGTVPKSVQERQKQK